MKSIVLGILESILGSLLFFEVYQNAEGRFYYKTVLRNNPQRLIKMTHSEYAFSGCMNYHSEFTFNDGTIVSGVIVPFIIKKPLEFQLLRSYDMITYKQLEAQGKIEDKQKLLAPIDLADLVSARRIN